MECAKVEFLKKGFQATQLKDIVTAAKVTTGAIYRHFKDKEALFFALIEDVYHYTLDFLDNAEPYDKVGIEHTSFGKVKRKQQKRSIHAGLRRDGSRSDTSLSDGQGAEITIA